MVTAVVDDDVFASRTAVNASLYRLRGPVQSATRVLGVEPGSGYQHMPRIIWTLSEWPQSPCEIANGQPPL